MALSQLKPALQYSEGRSKPWSGAAVTNCFSEKADGDKAQDFALMLIPGLDLFAQISTDPIRGAHQMGDALYVVSGTWLYSVTNSGLVETIGVVTGAGPVTMQDNGSQLAIAAAPFGYVYSSGNIYSPADLPPVSDVAYIDSYFVWSIANSDQCIYSAPNNGLSYDALDVFTAEGAPDGLVGLVNNHRELQLYGTRTIEIWYNSGGADNAFERQGNAFIERGAFSRDSIAKIANSVHFFGDDRIVYRLDGYTPTRISTHAIEYKLRDVSQVSAFVYTQEGHKFYIISSEQGTFAFDIATGAWHERRSHGLANYRVGGAEVFGDLNILTDAYTGRLYTPNLDDNYTENGDPIEMEVQLPTLEANRSRVSMYYFEVYCETGVGLNAGQGANPQIMMQYSDNGGRTYSNEMWRSMGGIGEYKTRCIWRNLGQFRQRDIKMRVTGPVRRVDMG